MHFCVSECLMRSDLLFALLSSKKPDELLEQNFLQACSSKIHFFLFFFSVLCVPFSQSLEKLETKSSLDIGVFSSKRYRMLAACLYTPLSFVQLLS